MAEPTVMLSDTAEKFLADFFLRGSFAAEAGSHHRRGKRGTRSERRREARNHVSKHPSRCPEEVGDGRRGELGVLPPARWNLGKNRDGQRRMERRKHTTVWENGGPSRGNTLPGKRGDTGGIGGQLESYA